MALDIATLRNRHGKVWLNVASGAYVVDDFVNFDNSVFIPLSKLPGWLGGWLNSTRYGPLIQQFRVARGRAKLIRHDCRRPLPVADGTADHILCSHFLEHIYPPEATGVLEDFRRVLRPGGTLHLIVPNLRFQVNEYVRRSGDPAAGDEFVRETLLSHPRRPSLKYRFMELLGYEGLHHRWMYDPDSLARKAELAGFGVLPENTGPSRLIRNYDGEGSAHVFASKD